MPFPKRPSIRAAVPRRPNPSPRHHRSFTIPANGATSLHNRRLLSLHGRDAPKFLQGICTSPVTDSTSQGFYTAFLTAPGKILADAFVYPTRGSLFHGSEVAASNGKAGPEDPGFLVEVDGGVVEQLAKHLKKHKLRSQFVLRTLELGELLVWSRWGEVAEGSWPLFNGPESHPEGAPRMGLMDRRAPGMGQRLLVQGFDGEGKAALLEGFQEADPRAYRVRRFLRGVPEGVQEIGWDEGLPMNFNMDLMGGIDFRKGCYVGQELTIRTHHTGVVRRRVLPVALSEKDGKGPPEKLEFKGGSIRQLPETGTDIRREEGKKRAVGKFIAAEDNIGLAMCRLEQMSDLRISGEGSSHRPEDRFTVQTGSGFGEELNVKAFVPDWMRGKIREPKIQRRVE